MRAGRLRHKISIHTPTSTVTPMGEIEASDVLVGTFYADVMAKTASEVNDQGTLISATQYTIFLRYNSTDLTDVSPASKLHFDGKVLQVESVSLVDSRRRIIEIRAQEAR